MYLKINSSIKVLAFSSNHKRLLRRINIHHLCSVPQVFDEIPERANKPQEHVKLVKYGNVNQTMDLFCQSFKSGTKPTKFVLCTALNSCAKTCNFHLGMQLHGHVIKRRFGDNLFLNTALVDLYAKCDMMSYARKVFDEMKRHDEVSWTSIISGLSKTGRGGEAVEMFKEMLVCEVGPNCVTYVGVISACKEVEEVDVLGMLLHGHVIKFGFGSNSFVMSSLIDCYSKCGRIDLASRAFSESRERDGILFNSMISGYSQNLYGEQALKLFVEMRDENLTPTNHTFTSVLNACGSLTTLQQGKQLHSLFIKMGSEMNVFVASALIDMYSKCGSIQEAQSIFDQAVQKNHILWTSLIVGYAQSSKGSEALELFERFIEEGFAPDNICFTAVLTACNHAGYLDKGIEYFNKMKQEFGLFPNLDQYACLVDLYARNGHLKKAKELMEEMPYDPNYVMWSSFLSYCKIYGEVELGRFAADQLFKLEPKNAAPYIALVQLYARADLWAQVSEVRKIMQNKGIRKSAGWSWIEVDNAVHVFMVGDTGHPLSQEVYRNLDKLNLEMKEVEYTSNLINLSEILDDE